MLEAASILYRNTPIEELTSFESIEKTVRTKMKRASKSKNCFFFIKQVTGTELGRERVVKSVVGKVTITQKQAQVLGLKPYSQLSPLFEKNCRLLSGNESFQDGEKDIEALTGIKVSHSTLQRLVQRIEYEEPQTLQGVSEVSIDGGKVRLRSQIKGVESYVKGLQSCSFARYLLRYILPRQPVFDRLG